MRFATGWLRRAAAALLAMVPAFGANAADYKSEYRLSTVLPATFAWGAAGERWAALVGEKTGGRIAIKMYPGASLVDGDQTREFAGLLNGTIDMAIGSTINWSPQVEALNLFSLPFLMHDFADIDTLTRGPVGRELFRIVEGRGPVPLAWGENGFRELSNSRRPITSPEDMKGLKLRVVGSPLFIDTMASLGAIPVELSWSDAKPALAERRVDGQENPLGIFLRANLAGLGQTHLTLWEYVADPLIFAVNREVWEGWTPADREAVRQAAVVAAAENVAAARRGLEGDQRPLLREIEAQGVRIVTLDVAGKQAFRAATRSVYDKWAKIIGEDLVRRAEEAVKH
ncbi:MAG: TRAP transporter substrate-binding protein DctP [Alphaproteobacteria bacterium]|nr:TRAP transporter substrate-binding protein DctP [Alphaproteobacteria bacterium]